MCPMTDEDLDFKTEDETMCSLLRAITLLRDR
jgi:hypothetical protein